MKKLVEEFSKSKEHQVFLEVKVNFIYLNSTVRILKNREGFDMWLGDKIKLELAYLFNL